MESGLEDRNNEHVDTALARYLGVSMESGLEDRNNFWPSFPLAEG